MLRDIGDRRLRLVDRLQDVDRTVVIGDAVFGGVQALVVRLNRRTPRCFSSLEIRLDATAGETCWSRAASDMLPSS